MRCVQCHRHQQARDQPCARQCDDPGREDESDLLPVDSANIEVTEGNTDRSTSQTLRGRNRQRKPRSEKNGDGGAEFHRETSCWRNLSDFVAERAHDMVAVDCAPGSAIGMSEEHGTRLTPEAQTKQQTSDDQDPDRSVGAGSHLATSVGIVAGNPGAHGVRDYGRVSD